MKAFLTIVHEVDENTDVKRLIAEKTVSAMSWSHAIRDRDESRSLAARLEAANYDLMVRVGSEERPQITVIDPPDPPLSEDTHRPSSNKQTTLDQAADSGSSKQQQVKS